MIISHSVAFVNRMPNRLFLERYVEFSSTSFGNVLSQGSYPSPGGVFRGILLQLPHLSGKPVGFLVSTGMSKMKNRASIPHQYDKIQRPLLPIHEYCSVNNIVITVCSYEVCGHDSCR